MDQSYTGLQDAIDNPCDSLAIWVAAGTYYPTASPDGTTSESRDKAFHLHTDMRIYGGFVGTDTLLSQRDWTTNVTILSGDIDNATDPDVVTGSDSTLSITGNTGNAYHVLITTNLTDSTFIDGFTIKGGNADGGDTIAYQSKTFYKRHGGGMYNDSYSSPTIANSIFTNNYADIGGGMYNYEYSSPMISNATFMNNKAGYGGGMHNEDSSPTITNSTFTNNYVSVFGGGMHNFISSPRITNSTFTNNYAVNDGCGMYNVIESSPTITNSIIWNNGNSEVANANSSTPTFKNSIIKGSGGSEFWNTTYGIDSGANLDTDPLFVDAATGDYRIKSCSPAFDTGTADTTGLDLGLIDLAGNARVFGGRIDMGAYESSEVGTHIVQQAQDLAMCQGNSGTFSVQVTGTGMIYRWQEMVDGTFQDLSDASIYSGTASPTLSLTFPSEAKSGSQYRLKITENSCEVFGSTATLTVKIGAEALAITNISPISGVYFQQAVLFVVALNKIESTAKATYQAGNNITLLPGFETKSGSIFKAQIQGSCANTFTISNAQFPTSLPQKLIK